jgi:hypothetical protein
LTADFQNFERTARRVVIEDADHQAPSIPSEGIKVGSVLLQDRAIRVLIMAVYDMALPVSVTVVVIIDFPDDNLWVLPLQREIRIDTRMYENPALIDVHLRQLLEPPQVLVGYDGHVGFIAYVLSIGD